MRKVYVITGGSGGMGLECAKQFTDGIVLITDINEKGMEAGRKALDDLGIDVRTMICDISQREQVADLAKYAASLGRIEAVLNTAGVSGTAKNVRLVFNVDLLGTAYVLEEFLPYVDQNTTGICIASMMGYTIPANPEQDNILLNCTEEGAVDKLVQLVNEDPNGAYNMSKRGVHLLVEKHAEAWGKKGARILSISPGIIDTPMAVEAAKEHPEQMAYMQNMTPLHRNGQPVEIANVVKFLCSDQASFMTGCDIRVDGGLIKNLIHSQAQQK